MGMGKGKGKGYDDDYSYHDDDDDHYVSEYWRLSVSPLLHAAMPVPFLIHCSCRTFPW
jgi:hypothetical protein